MLDEAETAQRQHIRIANPNERDGLVRNANPNERDQRQHIRIANPNERGM